MAVLDNLGQDMLRGRLVRLCSIDAETLARHFVEWRRSSEFIRLLDSGPAALYSQKSSKAFIEKELQGGDTCHFAIRRLEDDRVIGDMDLNGVRWNHGDAFVGIGIGVPEFWGRGYGTDAMNTILRYAFTELNLHRVTLNTFDYNPRALRSYEKCGFRQEGVWRQFMLREGRRWDLVMMGILRREWLALNGYAPQP